MQPTKDGSTSLEPLPIDDLCISDSRLWATVRVDGDPTSPLLLAYCPYPLKANVPWTFLPSESQSGAAVGVAALLHVSPRDLPPFSSAANGALVGSWSKAHAQKCTTGIGRFLEQLSQSPEKFVLVSKKLQDQLPKPLPEDLTPSLVLFCVLSVLVVFVFSAHVGWDGDDIVW